MRVCSTNWCTNEYDAEPRERSTSDLFKPLPWECRYFRCMYVTVIHSFLPCFIISLPLRFSIPSHKTGCTNVSQLSRESVYIYSCNYKFFIFQKGECNAFIFHLCLTLEYRKIMKEWQTQLALFHSVFKAKKNIEKLIKNSRSITEQKYIIYF